MDVLKPRTAELVLVTPEGDLVGCLPAVPVATPWWPDIEPVVAAVREHHGVDVILLRLLDAEFEQPHGGQVTYLAEVAEPVRAARPSWTSRSRWASVSARAKRRPLASSTEPKSATEIS
jgi:hypothetical protein